MNFKNKITAIIKRFRNTFYYLIRKDNCILINSCMSCHSDRITHMNFGDDLNYYLIKALTNKTIVNYSELIPLPFTNFMAIGSVIDLLPNRSCIVWGSGVIDKNSDLRQKPNKILAVRGKLTREYLINKGIDCPEIYGDPALLVSKIVAPSSVKKYKYGLIPHVTDIDNNAIYRFLHNHTTDAILIDFKNYTDWKKIILEITECELIISSSLHGLILSDAYNIPNIWVRFSNQITGGNFKYHDYFSSVNRPLTAPEIVDNEITTDLINRGLSKYQVPQINLHPLIDVCPFNIRLK